MDNKYKAHFVVPCVEFQEDIDHFSDVIRNAGGTIVDEQWNGEEDEYAVILYECQDQKTLRLVQRELEIA